MLQSSQELESPANPERFIDSFVVEHQRQRNLFEEGGWDWKNRSEIESALIMILKSRGGKQWWTEAKFFYMHHHYLDQLILERSDVPMLTDLTMFTRPISDGAFKS